MAEQTTDYSKTVILPKTDFPMKAGLSKKEPSIIEFWNKLDIYRAMLKEREGKPPFILHDGPPYANGKIHTGHALNKILKDIAVKSRAMSGHYTPYIPGWDCHGLPIEHALLKEMKTEKKNITDIPQFRRKAREFAAGFIKLQKEDFKRLGVFGDWENPYMTMSPRFEGSVIDVFLELLKQGYIYRGKKTVLWCTACETALADAETEYKDKTSPSIYVRLPLIAVNDEIKKAGADGKTYLVIWTTTPWTLPANRAAAVSETENYGVYKNTDGSFLIMAEKLADEVLKKCGLTAQKTSTVSGRDLTGLKYHHPILEMTCPVISTDFVTMDTGSGIVHIAPGHGEDDFYAGLKWKLETACPVNERGVFTDDAGKFAGMHILKGNTAIIEHLTETGLLLLTENISHSYPHCWRCKSPVIFRATEQWFLSIDKDNFRQKLGDKIDEVNWIPSSSKERISSMVKNRPDWCLSRQRAWGTPVPVIYCAQCGKVQTDDKLTDAIKTRAYKEGSDFWFTDTAEKIVPANYKCSCGATQFKKDGDILDVWLDSGVSWKSVLEENNLFPADLYLEGSDQHRGWFQSSLIPGSALKGRAPYKNVLTHGFVLDENGKAMHKSAGNVVPPQDVSNKYGADILRLWVALSDYNDDVRISDKLLEVPVETYRKIRNTLRYLLGNLWDFEPAKHAVKDADLLEQDLYVKHLLSNVSAEVKDHYLNYRYRRAIRAIADFCILDLSSFYMDMLKDRLYTLGANSKERRSAQTVLYETLLQLLKLTAPILSFTCEEALQNLRTTPAGKGLKESIFLENFSPVCVKDNPALIEKWTEIRRLRDIVLKSLEDARREGVIGSSVEAKITFRPADGKTAGFIKDTLSLWPAVAIVSGAQLAAENGGKETAVEVQHADGAKCPRCWQWKGDIGARTEHPALCKRCADVLINSAVPK